MPTSASALPQLQLANAPTCAAADGARVALALADALMLAWLAVQGPTPRERMAALLWPASSAAAARNTLRQRVFRLRKTLGRELLSADAVMSLTPEVTHDLTHATTLLGELQASDNPELQDWLTAERERRKLAAEQATQANAAALEAAGDVAAALPLALALLAANPLSEQAHQRVMRLHYLCGDRASAMLAFDHCEAVLKHEVGTAPSQETLALLHAIESQAETPELGAKTTSMPVALLRPPRMVGRQTELAALQKAWASSAVVVLQGEAGMGKSRLLRALTASPQPDKTWLVAAGRPGDALVPYATFARLLAALLALVPQAFDAPLRTRLAPLLPSLAPQAAMSLQGSRHHAPHNIAEPVAALLAVAQPHIEGLVLDDAHFADAASLDLLEALLAAPRLDAPQRWCLGLRPPDPGSRLLALMQALGRAAPVQVIHLQPLGTPQVAELVDSLMLPGVQGALLAKTLRQRSGGNPLFALETLKLAWTQGGLRGGLGLADSQGSALPTPQSLAQLIGLQLARLSSPALMLARLAAIAGADFSLPLAMNVLGQNALQLADPWSELEKQQLLLGTDFAHDLIFETVVAGLPEVIARHLHAQVAHCVEAAQGEPARIAAHWEAAGQRERALPALHAAAERAHAALRERERINFLLRAADIAEAAGDKAQAFDCVARAVDTHMNSIRQASGFSLLDRLDGLAHTAAQRCDALGQRAWYCIQLADVAGAIQHGKEALDLAQTLTAARPDAPTTRRLPIVIRQRLATALAMDGQFDEALAHFQALLSHESELHSVLGSAEQAELHDNYAVVLDNLGRTDDASQQRGVASTAASAGGDTAQQVSLLANHAVSRLNAGDVRHASQLVAQAQQLIQQFEMRGSTVGFCAVLQMQCARALGHYAQALQAAEWARVELQASNPARLPVVQLHLGHVWLDLGQFARAQQALDEAGAAGPLAGHLPAHQEARRLLLLAQLAKALGRPANTLLAQAQAAAPTAGWPEMGLVVACELAQGLPTQKALSELKRVAAQALRLGHKGTWLLALAQQAQLTQNAPLPSRAAARLAEQALAAAEDAAPTLAYCASLHWAMANTLAKAGQTARATEVLLAARSWVQARAQQDVPAPFVDSFLQRNAVNRALLHKAPWEA